jgi:nucleotide-binding universal stress UspA family protein
MQESSKLTFQSNPIKRVLIALDYDNHARKIAEMGYSIAESMNAEVVLLHVLVDATYYSAFEYSPMLGMGGFSNTDFSKLVQEEGLKQGAKYFLENIKTHLGDENISTKVGEGNFADIILNRADNYNSDLIVLGSHKKGWFEKMLAGDVTEQVLHQTEIPLLIVPIKE